MAVAYSPTLARLSARNSRYGIGGGKCGGCVSHQELSMSPSYCCCRCEPNFDPSLVFRESRHDALDSPSTPCIRVPSPLLRRVETTSASCARRGGTCCEVVAVARLYRVHLCRTAVRSGYLLRTAACYEYLVHGTGTWYHTCYAWSEYDAMKSKCLFLHGAVHLIRHSFKKVPK